MHDAAHFPRHTHMHLPVSRSIVLLYCIIDREAVREWCFALELNKSTPWINHQIKPYLQPGKGHQPYPVSFTQSVFPPRLFLLITFRISSVSLYSCLPITLLFGLLEWYYICNNVTNLTNYNHPALNDFMSWFLPLGWNPFSVKKVKVN